MTEINRPRNNKSFKVMNDLTKLYTINKFLCVGDTGNDDDDLTSVRKFSRKGELPQNYLFALQSYLPSCYCCCATSSFCNCPHNIFFVELSLDDVHSFIQSAIIQVKSRSQHFVCISCFSFPISLWRKGRSC